MFNSNQLDKVLTKEQMTQIVEAIAEGKYSWACVLTLRSGGYNPLLYIPYSTYNRLVKENTTLLSPRQSEPTIDSSAHVTESSVHPINISYG